MRAKVASGIVGVLLLPSLIGCASAPAPNDQMTTARAAVRTAEALGAQNVPKAELHVRLAQEQIERANKLIEDGENERAAHALKRAAADAELAVVLAKEAAAREAMNNDVEGAMAPATKPEPEANLKVN